MNSLVKITKEISYFGKFYMCVFTLLLLWCNALSEENKWKKLMIVDPAEGEKFYKVLQIPIEGTKYLFCSKIKNNKVHAVVAIEYPNGRATSFAIGSWIPKRIVDLFISRFMSNPNVKEIDPTKEGEFSF